MRSVLKPSSLLTLTVIIAQIGFATPVSARVGQESETSSDFQRDLAELDSYLGYRDLDTLRSVVDQKSKKWGERDRTSFVAYMFNVCTLLSSYDIGDTSKRAILLSRYAMLALATGELSIQDQVRFVEFLMFDPVTMEEAGWRRLREQKARLWLSTWRRLTAAVDPAFAPNDFPLLNVPTPPESALPAGSPPDSIKDPKLRAEYESAIAQNAAKARRYHDQDWLKKNASHFYAETERYLINAYSMPPEDLSQLQQLLSEYLGENRAVDRIIDQVREKNSSRPPNSD
jgi:hypothetical protein